ncbi:MAG: DUF2029 domain-containing protein, partial [Chloroflexi bacterium]|nr:DUF2029 domain-containing protein [Chloroflexota bacterium]
MIAVSAPATTQWPVRLLQALPWAVGPVLAVTAAVLWYSVVGLAVDRLDGSSSEPREDIVAFYVAGKLLREGRAGDLYIVDVVAQEEAAVLGRPAGYHGGLAFLNPPFVAALFAPLSLLPYRIAQAVWLAVDIAALGLALALLAPELRRLGRGWRIVFVLGVLASFPVFIALLYVQLSPLVLLSWVGSYRLIRAGREHWAGIVLAGALMKPPLALLPAAFLLVSGRWRVVASFGVASLALAAASVALVGPDTAIRAYGQLLSESAAWRFDFGIDRPHMFGWTGFFSLALGERLTA